MRRNEDGDGSSGGVEGTPARGPVGPLVLGIVTTRQSGRRTYHAREEGLNRRRFASLRSRTVRLADEKPRASYHTQRQSQDRVVVLTSSEGLLIGPLAC